MSVSFRPAVRENVPLLIALSGPSGGGKTFSALRLARGLAGGDDNKVFVVDTESGRALHYAPPPGSKPDASTFGFQHAALRPPFRPEAYAAAIRAADKAGAKVVVVDSMSHEWSGEGGVLDWHEEELSRMAGDNYGRREALKMPAWIKPKMGHKAMMQALLQVRCHVIFCLRAEEKVLMAKQKDDRGQERTVVIPAADRPLLERWTPVCDKGFMYEVALSLLLLPDKPGVPRPVKIQEQHKVAFPEDKPITETSGGALAAWASGGSQPQQAAPAEAPSASDRAMAWADAFITTQRARLQSGDTAGFAKANAENEAKIDKLTRVNPDAHKKVVEFLHSPDVAAYGDRYAQTRD
ncbi:MAG: hypothetical protein EA420_16405 [Candidatus Competibacteraceae bacterium]|nr:MAG: hypothetical protein EA420_16405 [Candidatus Competibacteraceae bacterium]